MQRQNVRNKTNLKLELEKENAEGFQPTFVTIKLHLPYFIISAESQKGAIVVQRCSIDNQKGAIAIDFVQR